jgi:hypothetical protein
MGLGFLCFQEKVALPEEETLTQQKRTASLTFIIIGLVSLGLSLGCSVGALAVQVPTPTSTPHKTPRPTYTFTPPSPPTFTPSPTPTPTSTPTETPIPTPTEIVEETEAPAEPVQQAPPQPAAPTDTPTPEEPTATPTPAFPFTVAYFIHDTGSAGETRMTAWIRVDYEPGRFKTLSGFQMKALAPDGNTYLSELSGSGFGDSTVKGTGDNHNMNTKLEFRPYTPGIYKIMLVEGDTQMSPEIEIALSADPMQYAHFDFAKQE